MKNNVEKQATEEKVNLKLSVSDHNAAAINKARARIKVAVAVINEIDVQIGKQSTQTSERIIINDPHWALLAWSLAVGLKPYTYYKWSEFLVNALDIIIIVINDPHHKQLSKHV